MPSTQYVFNMGELYRKDNSIAFKNSQGNHYIPIEETKELYILNEVSLNSKFLDFVAKAGIVIHFFNYRGYYSGSFYSKEIYISGDSTIKQVDFFNKNRIKVAKSIVLAISNNIYEVLYHYYRHDKKELKDFLDWLKVEPKKFLAKDINIKQILFIEGQIWHRFYESFKYFLPEDFIMNKRVKRPPDNSINALVSFGNSLLYAKTISSIYHTHLNQSISFLHEPTDGRFSLSLDLSEAFKPIIVFKTIFELVNRKQLQVSKHFDRDLNYSLLNEDGKKIFLKAYENRLNETFKHPKLNKKISYLGCIKIDGYKLLKAINEDIEFKPFSIKDKC